MRVRFWFLVALAAILLFYVVPAFAQTIPPVISPPVSPGDLLANALAQFLQAINVVTYLPKAVALVVIGTAILKRYLPPEIHIGTLTLPLSSGAIALTLQVIAWVIYVVTLQLGYGNQFDTWVSSVTTILQALFGGLVSSVVATVAYNKSVALGVPVVGYQRPLSPSQMASKTDKLNMAFASGGPVITSVPARLHPDDIDRIAQRVVAVLEADELIAEPTDVPPQPPTSPSGGPPLTSAR